jgi:chromosome segregation ATPase
MRIKLNLAATAAAALLSTGAFAQSETDRLRDALRSAITQTRALEDQRTALQARLAEADRDKAALKADVEAARAQVKRIENEHREAVEEFNQRLTERDETLEKWKTAYEEAANVARAKDAERAKFEGEANAYKASTKSCVAKNDLLVKTGQELVQRYKMVAMDHGIAAYEKMFQFRRVELQNEVQDANDRFLDQKVKP